MFKKKEPEVPRCKRIMKTIYNPENKAFLGRTAKSWAQILLFYVAAYSFLAAFFVGMISVFMYGCVNKSVPNLTGMQSILKSNPGLGFRPRLSVTSTFIHLTTYPSSVNGPYLVNAKKFLDSYINNETNLDCPNGVVPAEFPTKPCRFPLDTLGDCRNPELALKQKKPCMYIRLNNVFGWLPDIANASLLPTTSIQCAGQNPADTFLLGNPTYFPNFLATDGKNYAPIPNTFFPFLNQKGYQTPIVAVQFPNIKYNTVILVECKVYGLLTDHSSIKFELLLDSRQ